MNPFTPSPSSRRLFVAAAIRLLAAFLAGLALFSSPAVAQVPPAGNMRVTRSAPNTYTVSVATDPLWEYRIEATDDLRGVWDLVQEGPDSVFY